MIFICHDAKLDLSSQIRLIFNGENMAKKQQKFSARKIRSGIWTFLVKIFSPIDSFLARITKPVRDTKVWKFLRRTILRSPFRGYFLESFRELKKVTWPSRKTTWKLTATVFFFSVFFAAFTSLLDLGFNELAKNILLK